MTWWIALIYAIIFVPAAYFTILSIYKMVGNLLLAWSGNSTNLNSMCVWLSIVLITVFVYFHYIIVPVLS